MVTSAPHYCTCPECYGYRAVGVSTATVIDGKVYDIVRWYPCPRCNGDGWVIVEQESE